MRRSLSTTIGVEIIGFYTGSHGATTAGILLMRTGHVRKLWCSRLLVLIAAVILFFTTMDAFSITDARGGRNDWTDRELFVTADNTHWWVRPCSELVTVAVGRIKIAPTPPSLATTHGAAVVLQTVSCLEIG